MGRCRAASKLDHLSFLLRNTEEESNLLRYLSWGQGSAPLAPKKRRGVSIWRKNCSHHLFTGKNDQDCNPNFSLMLSEGTTTRCYPGGSQDAFVLLDLELLLEMSGGLL